MFCSFCGKNIASGSRFCLHCGKPVVAAEAASARPVPSASTLVVSRADPDNVTQSTAHRIPLAVFGIAVVCFFLPFASFSCQGQKIATLSGMQFVTGTTVQQPGLFGAQQRSQQIPGDTKLQLALVCGLVGVALGLLKGRALSVVGALAGLVGFLLLLTFKSGLEDAAIRQTSGAIQVEYAVGYWLVLLLYLAGAAVYAVVFFQAATSDTG